ncbi:hypothetical protein OG21DRAFT_1528368, partial [Imleria badia]
MEAHLLLKAARSDRAISHMRNDLANKIVRCNIIMLQLNRLSLENAQKDLHAADELVGHVRFAIRQSGHSVVCEHAIRQLEVHSPHGCTRLRVTVLVALVYESTSNAGSLFRTVTACETLCHFVLGWGLAKSWSLGYEKDAPTTYSEDNEKGGTSLTRHKDQVGGENSLSNTGHQQEATTVEH